MATSNKVNVAACVAEFLALMIFVIIGCGTAMVTPGRANRATYSDNPAWILMVSLTFGLAITTLAYSIGHYSGGHINCAVTFGLVLSGHCSIVQGVANLVSQLLGSIAGAGILYSIFNKDNDGTQVFGSNGVNSAYTWWNALIAEALGTFLLMFVVLQTAVNKKSEGNRANAAIAIGLAVYLAHMVLIHIDGCSINPTRSFGPALVASFVYGDFNKFMVKDMWIFWVGPLIGAAVAVGVSNFFDGKSVFSCGGSTGDGKAVADEEDATDSE